MGKGDGKFFGTASFHERLIEELKDAEVQKAIIAVIKSYEKKQRLLYEREHIGMEEKTFGEECTGTDLERKEELLTALRQEKEDAERELREINVKYEELKKKNKTLKQERDDLKRWADELEDKLEQAQDDVQKMHIKVHTMQTEVQDYRQEKETAVMESEKYKKNYQRLDEVYQLYMSLGSAVYNSLGRVLNPETKPCESAEIFFGYGVQEGNLEALWDIIANKANGNDSTGSLNALIEIFNYFFKIYQEVSYKKVEYYLPQEGELFDERYHTRTSESRVAGRIENVILPGFSIGRNITRKPLVYVV